MTQKKDNRLPILDEKARCICGAETYDPEKHPHGAVGLIRYRKSKYGNDGGYSVGCTRCGRLGARGRTQVDARGRTQVDARAHWAEQTFKYGPLKEDKDK